MDDLTNVKERIKIAMRTVGLTHLQTASELSEMTGKDINRSQITKYISGQTENIYLLVCFLVDKYGINLSWILRGEGEMLFSKNVLEVVEKSIVKIENEEHQKNFLSLIKLAGENKSYLLHTIADYYRYLERVEGNVDMKDIRSIKNG
jgi:hypothetical protein